MTIIFPFATLDSVRSFHAQPAKAGLFVILLFIAFLLPLKNISYAQNAATTGASNEIIVVFKNKPTVSVLSAFSNSTTQNLEIKNGITASSAMVFSVPDGDVKTAMAEIAKDPNVASVFPNYRMNLLAIPNDPMVLAAPLVGFPRQQWNLFNLKLAGTDRSAWDVTTGSASVIVAVIDTGVNSAHPDLAGKISSLVDCSSSTCATVVSMTDNHAAGHGTHVAGLVGAATNNNEGIAGSGYNTKIMAVKVMDAAGNTDSDNFFNAIRWAADHGAKVINTSFGVVADGLPQAAIAEYNNAAAYAWGKGAVVVAAAGNCRGNTNGREGCEIRQENGTITGYAQNSRMYPAASPNVISVAASTVDNTIASYSEQNDPANANVGNWISVAAPGGDGACTDATKTCIFSTVPTNQYFWQSGTSMASPQVAGVAALIYAANSGLTNDRVKNIIETTANKSAPVGSVTNFGLVDALAAVNAAVGNSTDATPTPTPTGNIAPSLTPTTATTSSATPTPGGPTATPTVTPYPTVPPRLPKTPPNPYPQAPYCHLTPPPVGPQGTCAKKAQGDGNCDGKIDEADFKLWQEEFDTMVSTLPANQSANFACVEGNTRTYFVDLVSFEIWRRNTSSGLIILPSPTPTITSIPPTNTPAPQQGGGGGNTGGGGGGGNTGGGGGGGGGGGSSDLRCPGPNCDACDRNPSMPGCSGSDKQPDTSDDFCKNNKCLPTLP